MVSTIPLQMGLPGGMELLVVLLIFLLLAAPVALLVLLVVWLKRRSDEGDEPTDDSDRIAELEAEVSKLREELQDREE
jgi:sec-independent protein translocase protein TatA